MIFEGLPNAPSTAHGAQRCCDGAATESLLRRSCAVQLRRAHSARRVSTRRMRPAFISPRVDMNFEWSWPTVLGHPPGPVYSYPEYHIVIVYISSHAF